MVLDVANHVELIEFLRLMQGISQDYPEGEEQDWKSVATRQKEWYFNDAIFMAMASIQRRWYSTYSKDEFQVTLRAKLMATLSEDVIKAFAWGGIGDFEQRALLHIITTRPDRWRMLCENLGLDEAPEAFVAYRGSSFPGNAALVVNGWLAAGETVCVPHKGLSSWSLLEGDPGSGARAYFSNNRVSTLFVAEVPMHDTFLDVFVDDAYFAHHGLRETEIIVGTGNPSLEIRADLARCRVKIAGKEFKHDEAENAKNALIVNDFWPRRT